LWQLKIITNYNRRVYLVHYISILYSVRKYKIIFGIFKFISHWMKSRCWKKDRDSLKWHSRPIEKVVMQLGSTFVLGIKYHGFETCYSYLLLILCVETRGQLILIKIRYTYLIFNFIIYDSIYIRRLR
jgi:hypothetical protein